MVLVERGGATAFISRLCLLNSIHYIVQITSENFSSKSTAASAVLFKCSDARESQIVLCGVLHGIKRAQAQGERESNLTLVLMRGHLQYPVLNSVIKNTYAIAFYQILC